MADVAERAGVSAMTVSRALKEGSQVSKATREKIMAAVNELGYVLDQSAGSLSSRKTGFVAAIVPSINNSNFADTARGITDELESTGLQLLLGYTDYSIEKEEKLIEAMLRRRPEGIILTGGAHTDRARAGMLESAGIPVVETWDLPAKPIDQVVGFSNEEAMGLLVKTLASQGLPQVRLYRRHDVARYARQPAARGFCARHRGARPAAGPPGFLRRAADLDRTGRPGGRQHARALARHRGWCSASRIFRLSAR